MSHDVRISARSGPLFLTDLAFSLPCMRGSGLTDISQFTHSNNMNPLPLIEVENLCHEQVYVKFFQL